MDESIRMYNHLTSKEEAQREVSKDEVLLRYATEKGGEDHE